MGFLFECVAAFFIWQSILLVMLTTTVILGIALFKACF
jgi:hypothetical protein